MLLSAAAGQAPDGPPRTEYLAEVWDTDRGLPSYAATSLAQTPDGFLWVGTFEGLARFDGVTFETISHATNPQFPGKAVTALRVDRQGRLWAGTDNGIACLEAGQWRAYPDAAGTPVTWATRIVAGAHADLWATAGERILRLQQDRFVPVAVPPGTTYLSAFASRDGQLWMDSARHFACWENGTWKPVPFPPEMAGGEWKGAAAGVDGGIWLAGPTTIQKFRAGAWMPALHLPPGIKLSRVVKFLEDSEGNLWVGDRARGLFQYRKDGRLFQFTRADGLPNLAVRSLLEDREKNIWVGTDGGGLVRLRRRAANIFDEAHGLDEIVIDSVAERRGGGILTATYGGGLTIFDPGKQRFSPALVQPGPKRLDADSLVLSVLEDHSGVLWASAFGAGIFRIRGAAVEQILPKDVGGAHAKSLLEDSSQTLWIGTNRGVSRYRNGEFHFYREESGLPVADVDALAADGRGGIWAGGPRGLFHLQDGHFQKFLPPGFNSYEPILCLYTGSDGSLWIGAEGRGLDRLRDGRLTAYGLASAPPVATPASIIETRDGYLWVGTVRHGLARVRIASLDSPPGGGQPRPEIIWLTKEDGLSTNQFRSNYQPAVWRGNDGRLWFATLKGLAVVDPARVRANMVVPPIYIESVEVNGRRIPVGPNAASGVEVPPGSHGLRFFYTAPSLTAPARVRFQYQLEGGGSAWLDTSERSASFGELRPGAYTFRVRAANNDGLWNAQPVALQIRVMPLVWETWWFRMLALSSLAMLTAAVAYGTQRRRLHRQIDQLRQEKALRHDVERLQSVLKVSEERFSRAFNASPFPLSIATLNDARFLAVNESFLERTGLRREEVIGHTRAELGLWDDERQRGRFTEELKAQGRVRGLDVEMRDRSGHVHHLIVSAEVIELDGELCLLSASNDITDRRLLEEQLHQAQKLESVGRLAGGVAHDFNNLLTVINGYSEMILKGGSLGESNLKRVQQIRKAGERAADLTRQLLAFSRKQVIQPRVFDLNSLVQETETMLHRVLPENIEIVTRLDSALGQALADPGQIHQVVLNLALNARDAMPAGGRLIMQTANAELDHLFAATHPDVKAGSYVLLTVTDTGIGMEESVRNHIFEPFFTTKGRGEGTGLGLATVYGIIRQSAGWIAVESQVAKGTTFRIYLPSAASGSVSEEQLAAARSLTGNETVLLVEDEPDVRNFAKEVLIDHGYRVLEASDGPAALQVAAAFPERIDLLLTDVVMPGLNGTELSRRLAAARPETKVLYMSGYTENVIGDQGVLEEGIAFVSKPLTADIILAKVRETLGT